MVSADEEVLCILLNPNLIAEIKSPPLDSILSQLNPASPYTLLL
jgi:hypothetical protein